MPQLDGLRALAVVAVIVHHYSIWGDLGDLAVLGVKLFFVLSGFLITGILLKARSLAEIENHSMRIVAGHFYARRALRIFPVYYSVVILAVLFNLQPAREIVPWLLTYTLNFHMIGLGYFVDHFAHFWSLCVEEQFYLFWPWVVLFVPGKKLAIAALAMVCVGPLYRSAVFWAGMSALEGYISTFACLDMLGVGSLLAILTNRRDQRTHFQGFISSKLVFGVSAALAAGAQILHARGWHSASLYIFSDVALAVAFPCLVWGASRGFGGVVGGILSFAPFVYVGRISYGLYIYHQLVPAVCKGIAARFGAPFHENTVAGFAVKCAATLIVASLSWRLMEKPVNDLKRHFTVPRMNHQGPPMAGLDNGQRIMAG